MENSTSKNLNSDEPQINYLSQFFKQSSHYLIGYVLIMISGFVSLPILTRIFSKSEYGVFSLVSITLWITLALTKAGMQESAVRFYGEFKEKKRSEDISIFYTTLFGSAFIFALFFALVWWITAHFFLSHVIDPEMRNLVGIISLLMISGSLYMREVNFLRAEQRTKILNSILVFHRYFCMVLGLAFVLMIRRSLQSYYRGYLISEMSIAVFLAFVLFKQNKLKPADFSLVFLKECLFFGAPFIGLELATFLIKSADRYIIQFFLGTEAVGVYSVGSNLCLYLRDALMFPLAFAITPLYMELWMKKGKEATIKFISKVYYIMIMIAVPVVTGFVALNKQVIIILASTKYIEASHIIPFIIFGAIIWGFFPLYTAGLYIQKQTKKITAVVFIAVVFNCVLNILLIPTLHIMGAAIATLITYVLLTIALIAISNKYLKFKINLPAIIKVIVSACLMFIIVIRIPSESNVWGIVIKIIVGAFTYSFCLVLLDKNIRLWIKRLIEIRQEKRNSTA